MIPCGVLPKTSEAVDNLVESAVDIIAGFEAYRFRSQMEKEFYDMDGEPVRQLLYVCLRTISHIWNRTLASRIELILGKTSVKGRFRFCIDPY